jgi:hypothetical protein
VYFCCLTDSVWFDADDGEDGKEADDAEAAGVVVRGCCLFVRVYFCCLTDSVWFDGLTQTAARTARKLMTPRPQVLLCVVAVCLFACTFAA